jgi:O-acetyl-ADP-ribose deacetylase (regulator of RNase III)
MIRFVPTSLFTSPAQTLVNTVNTVGVMGKGIALEFKMRYPEMFERYRIFCKRGELETGKLYLYKSPNKWVLNFPTKRDWRRASELEWIEQGLKNFVETYQARGITSVAFPQLGTGNGGLVWDPDVRELMEKYLSGLPIPVFIHVRANKADFIPEHDDPAELECYLAPREDVDFATFLADVVAVGVEVGVIEPADEDSPSTMHLGLPRNDGCYIFSSDELGDFWHRLRLQGALPYEEFPRTLSDFAEALASTLLKLPYIRPTWFMAKDGEHVSPAIRYAPRPTARRQPTGELRAAD